MTNLKMSITESDIAAIKAMSNNDRSNLAVKINATDPFSIFTVNTNNEEEIICPHCGNGSGNSHTGVRPNFVNGVWLYHCFKCNVFSGDLLKIIATANNLDIKSNFFEVLAIGAQITRQTLFLTPHEKKFTSKIKSTEKNSNEQEKIKIISSDIKNAQKNLINIPSVESRGLKISTLQKFHCGYLQNWTTLESRIAGITNATSTPRLIIPSGIHYLARLTVPIENFKDAKDFKFIKEKPHVGTKEPFGIEFIFAETATVIITEGEIDSMSIDQACNNTSIAVIATLGAAVAKNIKSKILETLDTVFNNHKKPNILILFDNDEAGKMNATKFCQTFIERGYPAVIEFLSDSEEKVDANNILCELGETKLAELIHSKTELAQEKWNKIATDLKTESILKEKKRDWQQLNGEISPFVLQDLNSAVEYLQSLTIDKITSTIANESKTLQAIALCQFYDFYRQIADDFLARISAAKKATKEKVKYETPDNPVADSVRATSEINLKKLKESVSKFFTQVNKSHKEFLKQKERQTHTVNISVSQNKTTKTVIPTCPIDLKMPNEFYFQKDGLFFHKDSGFINFSHTPLVVVKRLKVAVTNSFNYEIAFFDYKGVWNHKIVDATTLFDSKKILSLADAGISVTSNGAKFMCNYFDSLIHNPENATTIPTLRLFQHGGWTDENCNEFIYPADGDDYVVHGFNFNYKSAFEIRGDKDKWRIIFETMVQFSPAIKLTLGVALAAPLIRLLKIRNEWLHLVFRSGVGKTAILKLAASIYGNPTLLLSKFNSTSNAMETQSIIFNDLPSFVDELQSMKKIERDNADNLVYNFETGTIRRRNTKENSLRPLQFFKGVKVTTGEQGVVAETAGEGAISRCLELYNFDALDNNTAIEIHRFTEENFGLFGRDWIQHIISHKQNIIDTFKFYEKSFIDNYKENFPNHCTIVALAITAIIHFTDAIGSRIFVNKEKFGYEFENLLENLPQKDSSTNAARAIDTVADFIFAHPSSFPLLDENGHCAARDLDDKKTPNEILGFTLKNGDVAIFPRYLREKILSMFPNCAACVREFSERHFLDENSFSKKHPYQKSLRIDAEAPRYLYIFKKSSLISDDIEDK